MDGEHDSSSCSTRLRALVADDDPRMRQLVAELLRREGFDVDEVADGKALLLHVVEGVATDLVVSDVCMPAYSGLHVLRMMRTCRRGTPVLLMTAFGAPSLSVEVHDLQALLLDKPFTTSALMSAVRELLARSRH